MNPERFQSCRTCKISAWRGVNEKLGSIWRFSSFSSFPTGSRSIQHYTNSAPSQRLNWASKDIDDLFSSTKERRKQLCKTGPDIGGMPKYTNKAIPSLYHLAAIAIKEVTFSGYYCRRSGERLRYLQKEPQWLRHTLIRVSASSW